MARAYLPLGVTMQIKLGKNIGNEWRDCAPYCGETNWQAGTDQAIAQRRLDVLSSAIGPSGHFVAMRNLVAIQA